MPKVLLVYHNTVPELRATTAEHLFSFKKYCPHEISYLNLARERCPPPAVLARFDLIIFHYLFLTNHWSGRGGFYYLLYKALPLRKTRAVKVMVSQDEFYHPDLFCDFIDSFGIDGVFSVAPESEWRMIYRTIDSSQVAFFQVLTGYI